MTETSARNADLRRQLAQRLRVLRQEPRWRHCVQRPTEPRALAEVRADAESLGWLLRCTLAGYANLNPQPADCERVVETHDDVESFKAPAFEPLSVVLARAEAQGLDLEQVSVHQETRREPYEDWTNDYLVATIEVPVSDEKYAQAIDGLWLNYQQQQMGEQRDREDFATFLRLRERFGHLVDRPT